MVEKSHTAGWLPSLYGPFRGIGEKIADWFAPRSEASAAEGTYDIAVELPGVSSENIDVSVHDGSLTIKGEKRFEREEKGRTYFFSEREYGAFERSFRLPADAQADDITADFKNGVLTVKVPKVGPPPDRSKRIKVQTKQGDWQPSIYLIDMMAAAHQRAGDVAAWLPLLAQVQAAMEVVEVAMKERLGPWHPASLSHKISYDISTDRRTEP